VVFSTAWQGPRGDAVSLVGRLFVFTYCM
jgi:hypothetical protein